MEILMKVKCSTSPNSNGTPSTIKVVDHHHQLQQQHNPVKNTHPNGIQHLHRKHNFPMQHTPETMLPNPCLNYTTPTAMDCCTAAAQKHVGTCQVIGPNPTECTPYCEYAPCCSGSMDIPACCANYNNALLPTNANHTYQHIQETAYSLNAFANNETQTTYEYHEPEENFVSIEDEKIKAFLQKIGEEQKLKESQQFQTSIVERQQQQQNHHQQQQHPQQHQQQHTEVFEIIELDVARDVEKLQRLRESAEKRVKQKSLNRISNSTQFCIKTVSKVEVRKSPNISLIPKTSEPVQQQKVKRKENVIARINLLDSDSEVSEYDNEHTNLNVAGVDDDDDTTSTKSLNPLLAAAAVSCELGCDDDNDEQSQAITINYASGNDKAYVVASDEDNLEFINEREEGPELRWDDFEDQSSSRERQIFECHICAKTVQSNYNLRRHMMIHTGERPFGCDLCEKRFREISDLKKHRKRHASQPDFLCMICRINKPLETDSTRCGSCDTKNGSLIAAVRPDTVKPCPEIEEILNATMRYSAKRKNKSQSIVTEPTAYNNVKMEQIQYQITEVIKPPQSLTPSVTKLDINPVSSPVEIITGDNYGIEETQIIKNTSSALQALPRKREAFTCPLCKRTFGTRHNLKRHFMIHTGEKPYSCPHCRKPFREFSTLKKHMITHRRDRWYKCIRCPQKYRDYLDYMEHKNSHGSDFDSEGDAGENGSPSKRSKDDSFNSNDEDEEMEYDEDSLECCECGQRFTDIDQFSEHIKEHDLNRVLYECYICQQLFEEQKELLEHMNVKHQTEA